ncbi:hypothetical protein [Nocardioides luteus]|uniref:Uncharacterized protein n=1 Tax=Nocardioides luteus TaxID=1844 RepID=A0A1J4MYD9_9ACTN|nr:hypothetical protein [Nocardioides luteus]OIJ24374.1 hypothetical protein UG56_023090 [Nocardioides luteus]
MTRSILHTLFIASLVVALLGGLALIGLQAVGLVVGSQTLVVGPNGLFKTILCVAASISAVTAYLLTHVDSEATARDEAGATR